MNVGRAPEAIDPAWPSWRWLGVVVGILLAAAGGACRRAADDSPSVAPLRVGMELAYPPFEMTDEKNQPAGISVDMAKALGDYLDRPVVIENIPFDGLIPALRTGRIDCILSSMTATDERRQSVAFSDPYLETGLCLLVASDSTVDGVATLDAPGRKIAVKKGTTGHLYAADRITQASVLIFDKEAAAVLEVAQGKVDAFIYDQMSTYRNWQRHPETTRALLKPFRLEEWAIATRKEDLAVLEHINAFLREFREDGGFERLGAQYFADEVAAFHALGIDFLF